MKASKNATIRAIKKGFFVEAQSGYRLMLSDPDAFHCFVGPDIDLQDLGQCVMNALDASRSLSLEEGNALRASETNWKNWVEKMMGYAGISSQQKLFEKMALCGASEVGGVITFSPTIKRRGAAWEGRGNEFKVVVNRSDGAESVGVALITALDKCVPVLAHNNSLQRTALGAAAELKR